MIKCLSTSVAHDRNSKLCMKELTNNSAWCMYPKTNWSLRLVKTVQQLYAVDTELKMLKMTTKAYNLTVYDI